MEGTKKIKSTSFHQYSWNSEVETTWISLIGWHHKTSSTYVGIETFTSKTTHELSQDTNYKWLSSIVEFRSSVPKLQNSAQKSNWLHLICISRYTYLLQMTKNLNFPSYYYDNNYNKYFRFSSHVFTKKSITNYS